MCDFGSTIRRDAERRNEGTNDGRDRGNCMSWFPQIGNGSIAQFQVTRSRKWRAILNELESGEQIILPDRTAGQIEWRLTFQDLTDAEASALSTLFTTSQGSFGA